MSHLGYPACHHSPLGDCLRRIRLRHDIPRWVGSHWVQVSVSTRAKRHADEIARATCTKWRPQRWQPDHGRESPREELMSERKTFASYQYPGWMRFHRGNGPPWHGRKLLWDPFSERVSYVPPHYRNWTPPEPGARDASDGDIPF